jgi:hypothetical protein
MSKELGGIGAMLGNIFGPMKTMLTAMNPLVTILGGILEPLEPLSDMIGSMGEILGTALVPLVGFVLQLIMPFLPLLAQLANFLGPILLAIFKFFSPLEMWIGLFQKLIGFIPPDWGKWLSALPEIITKFFGGLPAIITTALTNAGTAIVNFFTITLPKAFTDLMATIGQVLADVWVEISSLGIKKTKTFG